MWPDWAIYWTLGNVLKPMAKVCPNLPHSWAIFVKVSKSLFFLVKSFLGNFYRHLVTFSGHTELTSQRPFYCSSQTGENSTKAMVQLAPIPKICSLSPRIHHYHLQFLELNCQNAIKQSRSYLMIYDFKAIRNEMIAKEFWNFAKVTQFCIIWSHFLLP